MSESKSENESRVIIKFNDNKHFLLEIELKV